MKKDNLAAAVRMLDVVGRRLNFHHDVIHNDNWNANIIHRLTEGLIHGIETRHVPEDFAEFIGSIKDDRLFKTEVYKGAPFFTSSAMERETAFWSFMAISPLGGLCGVTGDPFFLAAAVLSTAYGVQ